MDGGEDRSGNYNQTEFMNEMNRSVYKKKCICGIDVSLDGAESQAYTADKV